MDVSDCPGTQRLRQGGASQVAGTGSVAVPARRRACVGYLRTRPAARDGCLDQAQRCSVLGLFACLLSPHRSLQHGDQPDVAVEDRGNEDEAVEHVKRPPQARQSPGILGS